MQTMMKNAQNGNNTVMVAVDPKTGWWWAVELFAIFLTIETLFRPRRRASADRFQRR